MTIALLRGTRPAYFVVAFFIVVLFTGGYHRHELGLGDIDLSSLRRLRADTSDATARVVSLPSPASLDVNDRHSHQWYSEAKLRELAACSALGNCAPNAQKVVIIGALHCHWAIFGDYGGGEGVWCKGMVESLERQGYTVLFARDDWSYIWHLYRQIPDMVKVILANDQGSGGKPADFFKSDARPDGIPAWKFFWFYYFPRRDGPVIDTKWIACAEPGTGADGLSPTRDGFTYLGYSLKESTNNVPFEERPMQAYILSKRVAYFYKLFGLPNHISRDMITRAYDDLKAIYPDFEFVGAFVDDRNDKQREESGEISLPRGVKNLYPLNSTQFDAEVAKSRVLVGLGAPTLSPSPYRALARGVPFINAHVIGNPDTADDPTTWRTSQHETLRLEKPPYVYQVAEGNYTEFLSALKTALVTPSPPIVYERMKQERMDARMAAWVEHDWYNEAAELLRRRREGEKIPDYIKAANFQL